MNNFWNNQVHKKRTCRITQCQQPHDSNMIETGAGSGGCGGGCDGPSPPSRPRDVVFPSDDGPAGDGTKQQSVRQHDVSDRSRQSAQHRRHRAPVEPGGQAGTDIRSGTCLSLYLWVPEPTSLMWLLLEKKILPFPVSVRNSPIPPTSIFVWAKP